MTKQIVFMVFWASGFMLIEKFAPVDWTQLLIFLGMILIADAVSNQCR